MAEEYKKLSEEAFNQVRQDVLLGEIERKVQEIFTDVETVMKQAQQRLYNVCGRNLIYEKYWNTATDKAIQDIEKKYRSNNEEKAYHIKTLIQRREQKKQEENEGQNQEDKSETIRKINLENEEIFDALHNFRGDRKYIEEVKDVVVSTINNAKSDVIGALEKTQLGANGADEFETRILDVRNKSKLKLEALKEILERENTIKSKRVCRLYEEYRCMQEQIGKRQNDETEQNAYIQSLREGVTTPDIGEVQKRADEKAQKNRQNNKGLSLPGNVIE